MSLFSSPVPEPVTISIPPGSLPVHAMRDVRIEKLRAALAFLHSRWCLYSTRREVADKLHAECWDLL